jgi:tetratricopeptide (TPR) repeat protein
MDKAVALKPQDRDIRLEASSDALRRSDMVSAKRHLDAIPQKEQNNYKVRLARGVVELYENHADNAIENWRTSLGQRGGTDEDLTWRLAFVLLNLGRTAEALPLINQYRRLTGGTEPTPACKYLFALRDLKENRPVSAITALETLRRKATPILEPQIDYTLGQAYEAIRDDSQALDAYERATTHPMAKKSASPRLAKLRLLQAVRPEEAEVSLRKGLADSPEEPSLLIALARVEMIKQNRRPPDRRNWKDLEEILARARKVAPDLGALAVIQADYQAQNGQTDDAVSLLGQAVKHEKNKKDPEVWTAYANRLAMRGQADEALMVLERAADPLAVGDQAVIRIARAQLLTIQGHGQEAREALIRDIKKLPPVQRPLIWAALGDFYVGQKDYVNARKAYTEWANLLPEDPKPQLFLLERALADGGPDSEDQINKCTESLEKIGVVQGLYTFIAKAETLLRRPTSNPESATDRDSRFDKVERLIERIQKLAPTQRYGYLLAGQLHEARSEAYLLEKQLADTRRDVENAKSLLDAARSEIKKAIAAYEEAKNYEGGQAVLQKLIVLYARENDDAGQQKLFKDHPELGATQDRVAAQVALNMKENNRAKTLAAKVVQDDPDNLEARVWQANILTAMGEMAAAESTLKELALRKPAQPGPWLALLAWQIQKGQPKSAAATVEQIKTKVKTTQPEFLWAQCYRKIGDLAHALEYYEAALAKWPDDPGVIGSVVNFFEATGRSDEAETNLRGYIKRNPKQRWAPRALALLLSVRARQNPEAWEEASRLVGLTPTDDDESEDQLTRAIVLARSPNAANRKSATEQLELLISNVRYDDTKAALARRVLNEQYVESGQLSKARQQAQIDAQDNKPESIAVYAQALLREELWDQAEKQIEHLETQAPNQLGVVRLRALLLKGRGHLDDAVALLEKHYQERQDKPNAEAMGREVLQGMLALGPGAQAAADHVATSLSKRWPRTSWMLASFRAKEGRHKEALELYIVAAAHGSREAVDNAVSLALRDQSPERIQQADAAIEAALKLHPDDADMLAKRGFLRHFQHNYDDEIRLYEQALAHDPSDFRFLNNMAWTLSENLEQYSAAFDRINEAFNKAGAYPQFLDTRGVIFTRLNRLDEAIKELLSAAHNAKGTSSYPTIQFHLARAYYLANRKEDARVALERARSADPKLKVESLEPKERGELEELSAKLAVPTKP